jgi:hypothetical protein
MWEVIPRWSGDPQTRSLGAPWTTKLNLNLYFVEVLVEVQSLSIDPYMRYSLTKALYLSLQQITIMHLTAL